MNSKRILILTVLSAFVALGTYAQKESWLSRKLKKGKAYIDTMLVNNVDTNYIEIPKNPWRVVIYPKFNEVDLRMTSTLRSDHALLKDLGDASLSWTMRINPPLATYVGAWVGYRGLGIGYSIPLLRNAGRYWTVSSTGTKYGLIFSLRRFKTQDMRVDLQANAFGESYHAKDVEYQSYAPVWVRSVFIDGYYVFNGRRYSQDAAYNQSVIQRRSAGSLLLGLSWYQSSVDFSDKLNSDIIEAANQIGKIKVQQANIGIGYGYNWVPARNWLFNIMVMPTVSVYNRVKATEYDSNYNFSYATDLNIDEIYGAWNPETHSWANGERKKPIPLNFEDVSWQKDVELWETGTDINKTRWNININGRAGITYNSKKFFVNVYGQVHRFSYKRNDTKVKLYEWYINTQFGVRF